MILLSPAVVLALAAVVTATTPGPTQCGSKASAIPACATDCIISAGEKYGCTKEDYWCQCEPDTYANINGAAINCVLGACGFAGALPVVDAANAVCSCASEYPSPTSTAAPTSTDPPVVTTDPPVTTTDPPTPTTDSPSAGATYGCSKLDFWCQCDPDTYAKINGDALNCVLGACGLDGALPVLDAANAVCACASGYPSPSCTGGPTSTGTGPGGPDTTTTGPGGPDTTTTSTGGPETTPPPTGTKTGTPCSVTPGPTQCDASASAIPPCATDCIKSA
ncbi:hypothetical protein VE02_09914, partial [Pseudogymnoascus sp. 03VT05]